MLNRCCYTYDNLYRNHQQTLSSEACALEPNNNNIDDGVDSESDDNYGEVLDLDVPAVTLDAEELQDFDQAIMGINSSLSSLNLLETCPTPSSVTLNQPQSNNQTRQVGSSRSREMKLRREKAQLEQVIKNQEIKTNYWQNRFNALKEEHEEILKNVSSLKKENKSLSFALNFHKAIISNLDLYKSKLTSSEKLKFSNSFLSIRNNFNRAPKGCNRPVNPYYQKTLIQHSEKVSKNKFAAIKSRVREFYLDDENSAPSPGKKEFITRKKIKKGKRYLTDTITNLYLKFRKIHKNMIISRTTFFGLRPFWVVPSKISTRDTCLCKEHTNFKFLIEKLHYLRLINVRNSTQCLKLVGCEPLTLACLNRTCDSCKEFQIKIPEEQLEQRTFYYEWVTETKTREGSGKKCIRSI